MNPMLSRAIVVAAVLLPVLAWWRGDVLAGPALADYSPLHHPLAWLGADGVPRAWLFNAFGFVLPGLAAAVAAANWRSRLAGAGWAPRIGARLWLLSAIAFAAQGLLPLDPSDPHAAGNRLHALAWTLWWVAFVPGAVLVAASRGRGGGTAARVGRWLRAAAAVAALTVPLLALMAPLLAPPGLYQRAAVAVWFFVILAAAVGRRNRGAAPG